MACLPRRGNLLRYWRIIETCQTTSSLSAVRGVSSPASATRRSRSCSTRSTPGWRAARSPSSATGIWPGRSPCRLTCGCGGIGAGSAIWGKRRRTCSARLPAWPGRSARVARPGRNWIGTRAASSRRSTRPARGGSSRHSGPAGARPGAATYQLVGIDLRKNTLLYRVNLGRRPRAIAAGAGRVWLTTPSGQAAGQIVRIDPASGRIVQTLHLHAGPCTQLSFGWGHLFAGCDVGGRERSTLWRIDPVRQRGYRLPGMARGYISSLTAAPNALWYVVDFARISGLAHVTASRPLQVTARDPAYRDTSAGTQGLVYDAGSIWALGSAERLARIDAVTGDVVRHYSYRSYDPARAGGLDFLTAAGGWLWFLDNGYPFSGVLRVSEATGHPAGGVPIPPGSCGQAPCSLIYATPGSIWVPTAELLIRIDPSRLPG